MINLIEKLEKEHMLSKEEWMHVMENREEKISEVLFEKARALRHQIYGHDIYIRGLIEISNYCKNDCYYCGIRRSNLDAARYRLTKEEILSCADLGYKLGFRTFVMQGGEDVYYNDDRMCDIIQSIKEAYPDCAITLSLGEKTRESYQRLFDAGADRYLLRHETANKQHYQMLHPNVQNLQHRIDCLQALKEIGYQVGSGFMVGSPFQTTECLAEDMVFLQQFQPQMVGIGPFVPHHSTPFRDEMAGSVDLTLYILGLLRLMLPHALLPATTALGTLDPNGREKGILAGANVVMPNLSPLQVRKKYMLYDNKICTGDEAAESLNSLKQRMEHIGYHVVVSRGDYQ